MTQSGTCTANAATKRLQSQFKTSVVKYLTSAASKLLERHHHIWRYLFLVKNAWTVRDSNPGKGKSSLSSPKLADHL
jgi:hypothetical protein